MKKHIGNTLALLTLAAAPPAALAHTGPAGGLEAGLLHPLGGLDHLLAFLAMGLWTATSGRDARASLGAALGAMATGAVLAMNGFGLPMVEYGVLASVLVLGLAIAAGARLPQFGLPLVAGFALLHGYAHGSEIPALASGSTYVLGFLAASAAIQVAGLRLGQWLRRPALVRATGSLIALGGIALALAR